jgi:hypothetical protein
MGPGALAFEDWLGAFTTAACVLVSVVVTNAWHLHARNNKLAAMASNVTFAIRVQSSDRLVAATWLVDE